MIPTLKEVKVEYKPDEIKVTPIWNGVDRPDSFSWGLKSKDKKLAERLVRAVKAGVVLTNPTIQKDVNQQTYVSTGLTVRGRALNADLKCLGY